MTARIAAFLAVVIVAALAGCSGQPLPEEGTQAAALYAERCGRCHAAYHPNLMTGSMWETMVDRMAVTMKRRRQPLSPSDREAILAYLQRNAGTR